MTTRRLHADLLTGLLPLTEGRCSMRRPTRTGCALTLFALAAGNPAAAQVTGLVVDDRDDTPVAGALIVVSDEKGTELARTITGPVGLFGISGLPHGRTYHVGAHAMGYESLVGTRFVAGADPSMLELRLRPDPVRLEPITVTMARQRRRLEAVGFYRREKLGIGRHLRSEEIEARAIDRMSDVLRFEPSVRLVPSTKKPGMYLVTFNGMTLGFQPCRPTVVLDGMKVSEHFLLDELVVPSEVSAMELYPRGVGVPVQWSGMDAGCGVILIWTKQD